MKDHVSKLCQSCYFQLRQIRTIRHSLSPSAICTLVHAFISAHASTFQTASSTSSVGPELLSVSDSEAREIRPDRSCNPTRPSLAANPSSYTFQDERHHKKLSCGPSSRVLGRALPSYSTKSRRGATYDRRHKFDQLLVPRFRKERTGRRGFLHLIPTTVELISSRHSNSIRGASSVQKETENSSHAAVHFSPLRIYVTSATSTISHIRFSSYKKTKAIINYSMDVRLLNCCYIAIAANITKSFV